MSVNEDKEAVQIWCTPAERSGEGFLSNFDKYTLEYKGYKKVIFISGLKPVAECTAELLRKNKNDNN